mmetsp:Transcript_10403/g.14690  ORF Transcript_10403/g.14690 Transcript_10403/m.14690 type:complete len:285 (+) Transcript_10403:136-990(+)
MNLLMMLSTTTIVMSSLFLSTNVGTYAWIPSQPKSHCRKHQKTSPTTWRLLSSSSMLETSQQLYPLYASPARSDGTNEKAKEPYKIEGERIILEAAIRAGAKEEQLTIEWKGDRIVVTVDGNAFIPANDDDDIEMEVFEDPNAEFDLDGFPEDEESGADVGNNDNTDGVDVTSIARSINAAFDEEGEGSVGYNVAVNHSIEVTTPGASDELVGDIMFEAYKGFDVIAQFKDPKKQDKIKTVEGKLIGRTDGITTINVKGRMRKLKNDMVLNVKLPKAKREKGKR